MSWLVQARLADVANTVAENTEGVRVVRAFTAEQRQLGLLDEQSRRLHWANVKNIDIRSDWAPAPRTSPPGHRAGALLRRLVGAPRPADRGAIVAFGAYVLMLQVPFRMLGMLMMLSRRAAASALRIYEILDEQPVVLDRPGAIDLVECLGDVRFEDVHFDYLSGTPVLHGVDLHLRPGDTVALVGRTGTGKSTISPPVLPLLRRDRRPGPGRWRRRP